MTRTGEAVEPMDIFLAMLYALPAALATIAALVGLAVLMEAYL